MGLIIAINIVLLLAGFFIGWLVRWIYAKFHLSSSEQRAERITQDAVKEAEAKKREILLESKDQIIKERNQQEKELRERRNEISRLEKRLTQKEDNLESKIQSIEQKESTLNQRLESAQQKEEQISELELKLQEELEHVSGLTREQAKERIMQAMENEARHDAQVLINKIEQDAQTQAERKARDIIVTTIQRIATDVTSEMTITSVSLPNDEMKGRIIGREGRNIRTLETLTGVDIIIDDTPEAVVISCYDPVRKEIAKIALARLISDGRIHPARIEEMVQKVSREVNNLMVEEGEKVCFELNIHNLSPEGIKALGRLYLRYSYGQNVLLHSREVAIIAGMIAAEVGADREITRRAALLHDLGKGLQLDGESNHAEVGMDIARRLGEDPRVVNAIGAHHDDIEASSIEAVIVQIADAISASRPGARRESLDNYLKRLENLENIALEFEGVSKVYAIQAGREVRIMVNNETINDEGAHILAKDIAGKIESDLHYPGRIKVTIIRETRIVQYAK